MTTRSMLPLGRALALGLALASAACATVKPPTLQVQAVKKAKVGLTGARLDVVFGVRNPNPDDLAVDKLEFELRLNGHSIGRGYVSEPFMIHGFGEERVASSVNINYLQMPGAVRAVLGDDEVRAQARGSFYVREGNGLKRLKFDSDAKVQLGSED